MWGLEKHDHLKHLFHHQVLTLVSWYSTQCQMLVSQVQHQFSNYYSQYQDSHIPALSAEHGCQSYLLVKVNSRARRWMGLVRGNYASVSLPVVYLSSEGWLN